MGKACTFIGDNYIPEYISLDHSINETIFNIIEKNTVDIFYFSGNNNYQKKCLETVLTAKEKYPNIKIIFVANRLSMVKDIKDRDIYDDIIITNKNIYSPNFTDVNWHHKWAIDNSDIIVVYAIRPTYKFKTYIENRLKKVINLKKQYNIK